MKKYFPLCLDIAQKKCFVMGAGQVAWQKIGKLKKYGANIYVAAREILSPEIQNLIEQQKITYLGKEYQKEFMNNSVLIFAATDDADLNQKIFEDAEEKGILCNVADNTKLCRFISVATVEEDGVQIAISTHGKDSKRSRKIRQIMEKSAGFFVQSPLRIGCRGSTLALKQVSEFLSDIEKISSDTIPTTIHPFQTQGDYQKFKKIEEVEFYSSLEKALLEGKIDIAVHSAKDIDEGVAEGLEIISYSKSVHTADSLVCPKGYTLKTLPKNARIGVSGQRRKNHIQKIRPDVELISIRGNIDERIRLIQSQNLEGIIVAHAALIRLGIDFLASEILPENIFPTHPLQGKLAIEARKGDEFIKENIIPFLEKLEKYDTKCTL